MSEFIQQEYCDKHTSCVFKDSNGCAPICNLSAYSSIVWHQPTTGILYFKRC